MGGRYWPFLAALQGRGHVAKGVPGVRCWGSGCHTEEVVWPGPIPAGSQSRSQLPAAWESCRCRPSCAAPAFPALFITRQFGCSPSAADGCCCHNHGEVGRGTSQALAGERCSPSRMEQQGKLLLQSPASQPYPRGVAGAHPAANPASSSPPNPFPSCQLGVLGSPPYPSPPGSPACPAGSQRWSGLPAGAGEAAPGRRARSSAREESTCFQAQGNWSTLSFRCL